MTITRKMIYKNEPLTPEQIEEIEQAKKMVVSFDKDCPELDAEQLQKLSAFRKQQKEKLLKALAEGEASAEKYGWFSMEDLKKALER